MAGPLLLPHGPLLFTAGVSCFLEHAANRQDTRPDHPFDLLFLFHFCLKLFGGLEDVVVAPLLLRGQHAILRDDPLAIEPDFQCGPVGGPLDPAMHLMSATTVPPRLWLVAEDRVVLLAVHPLVVVFIAEKGEDGHLV